MVVAGPSFKLAETPHLLMSRLNVKTRPFASPATFVTPLECSRPPAVNSAHSVTAGAPGAPGPPAGPCAPVAPFGPAGPVWFQLTAVCPLLHLAPGLRSFTPPSPLTQARSLPPELNPPVAANAPPPRASTSASVAA